MIFTGVTVDGRMRELERQALTDPEAAGQAKGDDE